MTIGQAGQAVLNLIRFQTCWHGGFRCLLGANKNNNCQLGAVDIVGT